MISRVESTWVRTPDALARQTRRERRRQRQDKERPEEELLQGPHPAEERHVLDLVA